MITLIGVEGSSEYAVAEQICSVLENYWPGITNSPSHIEDVKVVSNAKICGYEIGDIDIVVCGKFRRGRRFLLTREIKGRDGQVLNTEPISVSNLLIAIEVKDSSPENIRFDGNSVSVRYKKKWHNATDQNVSQMHSLKEYFQDQYVSAWLSRLIILRGVDGKTPPGVLSRSFTGADFLTEICALSPPIKVGNDWTISCMRAEHIERALKASIFRQVSPTAIDRKKMDIIAGRDRILDDWFTSVGKKLMIFRGRGGTGKTVLLLQISYRAFDEKGLKTLFLTYNNALTADVSRLMTLLGVPASPLEGGISVKTVMSVVLSWLYYLGIAKVDSGEMVLDSYLKFCSEALELIQKGALNQDDILDLKNKYPDKLLFDQIVVDEGQDWPQNEVELLKHLYGPDKILVADGLDQLVRGARADWALGVPSEKREQIKLSQCLRMKPNLSAFANLLAAEAGLQWQLEPNDKVGGGRIIVQNGSYLLSSDLHKNLLQSARSAGNAPIDFLFCVPPNGVTIRDGVRSCDLVDRFKKENLEVWDGTNPEVRKDFARSINTFRVVQYASCRGLEGWTVVLENFDDFWDSQIRFFTRIEHSDSHGEPITAREFAWRWCMIPLTRPIDTLVITLSGKDNELAKAIRKIAPQCSDYLEITS